MDTFLINRNSPLRSGAPPRLRHRSRTSESESSPLHLNGEGISSSSEKDDPMESRNENITEEPEDVDEPLAQLQSKSMLSYFMSELTKGYKMEADASEFVERRDRVYTSVNTPKNLEKFCAFGFLQCMDAILYMVTFLPLRILVAILRVLVYPFIVLFKGRSRALDAAQVCDLLKGVILVVSCFVTSYMDMSMIYHIVRGQSIIKFYVFYNMLDVMDKLISGFGQDVLDSLYWTAVEPRGRKREHFGTLFHLIFAIVYVVVHTVMILMQAIILNVAFNSHNKNLLTIMMSNNFVEIKGNLFKRLDKNNLCQITYGDVKERFHYLVLLLFVFIRNMKELQWNWDLAFPIIQDVAVVLLVEMIVDWIKHAFITKFNELSASSYGDFALGLAQDIASSQQKHAFTNFNDQVCRRMGFTPIPLICLLFMVCTKSFNISGPLPWLLVFVFYLCLISTKVLNSIVLLGWAQRLITERDKNAKATGTVVDSQVVSKKEDKGSAPKVKAEVQPRASDAMNNQSRPFPVSSSVAVNTETSFSADPPIPGQTSPAFSGSSSSPHHFDDDSGLTSNGATPYHVQNISDAVPDEFSPELPLTRESTPVKSYSLQAVQESSTPKGSKSSVLMDFQRDFFSPDLELSADNKKSSFESESSHSTHPLSVESFSPVSPKSLEDNLTSQDKILPSSQNSSPFLQGNFPVTKNVLNPDERLTCGYNGDFQVPYTGWSEESNLQPDSDSPSSETAASPCNVLSVSDSPSSSLPCSPSKQHQNEGDMPSSVLENADDKKQISRGKSFD
ncbi:transmembrane anterior posterior transformation protein 1 homolog [Aplysia californica]|uniref:Transmembrane anterior posterior transformation protein 1 homolog n=1 Tax=Aplysia californica TaxID=6500 RepID=A0ABM1A7Y4_APLCA|nr:transmembrane anterior posterior transformation protein 1 homolog [Aplysia californica]XP_012942572.1 transmembrane anterior posterior transformation protein 1 homolog [Aplysia californica]